MDGNPLITPDEARIRAHAINAEMRIIGFPLTLILNQQTLRSARENS
jgi:hypothetical protein